MPIQPQKRITQQNGFTLVEIIVAVAIFSVLAGIGTTVLLNALPNMRIKSAARDVYSLIMQAKNEAIRRGQNVTLLFNAAGNTTAMFLDTDADDQLDAGETVLVPAAGFQTNVTFDPTAGAGTDGILDGITFTNNVIVFTMRGIPSEAGTVGLQATDSQGAVVRQRTITVSAAGRVNAQ